VVPVFSNGKVVGVLDVDSSELDQFDETDAQYLQQIVALVNFK
jgi:GAF domain-containing protein